MLFKLFTTEELIQYCKTFNWTRTIKQLHVHHTWSPEHKDYTGKNGLDLQKAMREYHINTAKYSDIAQHLTLLPDGQWITGRDFNQDPASIKGWNEGAFCIEMLGNFDKGCDKFESKQAQAMYEFCAWLVKEFGLDLHNNVKFHRDNPTAGKTCPGSGIDRENFFNNLALYTAYNEIGWKAEGVKGLSEAGLLTDPVRWLGDIDKPMPAWATMIILNRIYKDLKG